MRARLGWLERVSFRRMGAVSVIYLGEMAGLKSVYTIFLIAINKLFSTVMPIYTSHRVSVSRSPHHVLRLLHFCRSDKYEVTPYFIFSIFLIPSEVDYLSLYY